MTQPLMPKATAVWLIENTALSFTQIAEFCGLHELEVQAIADDEVAVGMLGMDPVASGQLTAEEIDRCQKDTSARLKMAVRDLPMPSTRPRGPRYTPVAKRGDKPDAIAWLLKNPPELSDAMISRLIGTTKPTIGAVRDRSHWNAANIKARHPVELGLCKTAELNEMVEKAQARLAETAPPEEDVAGDEEDMTAGDAAVGDETAGDETDGDETGEPPVGDGETAPAAKDAWPGGF